MRDLKTSVTDAIRAAVVELGEAGKPFTPMEIATRAFAALGTAERDAIALRSLYRASKRFIFGIEAKAPDDRQAWLDLPEFKRIPKFVKVKRLWVELRSMTYAELQAHVQSVQQKMQAARKGTIQEREDFAELKRLQKIVRANIETPETRVGLALDRYHQSTAIKGKKRIRSSRS